MSYQIHIKRVQSPYGENSLLINKEKHIREAEWQLFEDTIQAAKERFINGEGSADTILGEMMELLNNSREELIRQEQAFDPSLEPVKRDIAERRAIDEAQAREMLS